MAKNGASNTTCAARGCKKRKSSSTDIHFFRFPKDQERSDLWVVNCGRDDLLEKSAEYRYLTYRLCSLHFDDSQFMHTSRKKLVWKAVPTLFGGKEGVSPVKKRRHLSNGTTKGERKRSFSSAAEHSYAGPSEISDIIKGLRTIRPKSQAESKDDLDNCHVVEEGEDCDEAGLEEGDGTSGVSDGLGNALREGQTYRLNVWLAKTEQSDSTQILIGYTPIQDQGDEGADWKSGEQESEQTLTNNNRVQEQNEGEKSEEEEDNMTSELATRVLPRKPDIVTVKTRLANATQTIQVLKKQLQSTKQQNIRLRERFTALESAYNSLRKRKKSAAAGEEKHSSLLLLPRKRKSKYSDLIERLTVSNKAATTDLIPS